MKKLKIILPVVLLLVGAFLGKTMLAPAPAVSEADKPKVHGDVYVMPKEFLVNLKDGRFAKLNVSLLLEHGYHAEATAAAAETGHATEPPEGYGDLPQEALVRDIVTDALTNASASQLIGRDARETLKKAIAKSIKSHTDVKVEEVLLTDVAVQ